VYVCLWLGQVPLLCTTVARYMYICRYSYNWSYKKREIYRNHLHVTWAVEAVAEISTKTGTGKASRRVGAVRVWTAGSVIHSTFIHVCHNTTPRTAVDEKCLMTTSWTDRQTDRQNSYISMSQFLCAVWLYMVRDKICISRWVVVAYQRSNEVVLWCYCITSA